MISCEHHDYIEIACTFRFPIKLTLRSGRTVFGVARDTQFNSDRDECIELENNGQANLVVLEGIAAVEVCIKNPHFQTIRFT